MAKKPPASHDIWDDLDGSSIGSQIFLEFEISRGEFTTILRFNSDESFRRQVSICIKFSKFLLQFRITYCKPIPVVQESRQTQNFDRYRPYIGFINIPSSTETREKPRYSGKSRFSIPKPGFCISAVFHHRTFGSIAVKFNNRSLTSSGYWTGMVWCFGAIRIIVLSILLTFGIDHGTRIVELFRRKKKDSLFPTPPQGHRSPFSFWLWLVPRLLDMPSKLKTDLAIADAPEP